MRVVPREDAGTWVIREPTSEIFEPASVRLQTLPQPNKFQDQFQIFFCDNLNELMKHYFHDFQVEKTITVRKRISKRELLEENVGLEFLNNLWGIGTEQE